MFDNRSKKKDSLWITFRELGTMRWNHYPGSGKCEASRRAKAEDSKWKKIKDRIKGRFGSNRAISFSNM